MSATIDTIAIEMIVPADEGPLLLTPLASIDGVDDGAGEVVAVADADADLDGRGRAVVVALGVGFGVAVAVGRGATTTTVPSHPWIVQ